MTVGESNICVSSSHQIHNHGIQEACDLISLGLRIQALQFVLKDVQRRIKCRHWLDVVALADAQGIFEGCVAVNSSVPFSGEYSGKTKLTVRMT